MINGYGVFLICWLFLGFVYRVYNSRNEEGPLTSCIAYAIRFSGMVWLIFQI